MWGQVEHCAKVLNLSTAIAAVQGYPHCPFSLTCGETRNIARRYDFYIGVVGACARRGDVSGFRICHGVAFARRPVARLAQVFRNKRRKLEHAPEKLFQLCAHWCAIELAARGFTPLWPHVVSGDLCEETHPCDCMLQYTCTYNILQLLLIHSQVQRFPRVSERHRRLQLFAPISRQKDKVHGDVRSSGRERCIHFYINCL